MWPKIWHKEPTLLFIICFGIPIVLIPNSSNTLFSIYSES